MLYRRMGRTGFEVSVIGLGMWGMGDWAGSDDENSLAAAQLAVDLGCNFFDTAWAYGNGRSDRILGRLLAANPAIRIITASKIPPKNGRWPARSAYRYADVFPPDHVYAHVEKILAALQQPQVDVLQFHVWDDSWADESAFQTTVETLKKRGLIRAFGLSLNRWEPSNGITAIRNGLVDVVQVIYNVFDQAPEDELFPFCEKYDVGVIARVPLDEGSLGGRLRLDTRFPKDDWRSGYFNPENLARTVERVERLRPIVPPMMTLPEMALRFVISNPTVSTTIVGMRNPDHVRLNLGVADSAPLSPELLARLREHRWDRKPAPWSD